jgi:hypothetical protein
MQPSFELILTVVVVLLIIRTVYRRRSLRVPRLGEGGLHSKRELRRIVNTRIKPVFDSPEQVSLEYASGGDLGHRDLRIIQQELGRNFEAWFRPGAPGVLVVERRHPRW